VTATDPHSQTTLAAVVDATTSSQSRDQLIAGLFHAHELGLVRMALLLVGVRATAEDVSRTHSWACTGQPTGAAIPTRCWPTSG